VRVDLLLTDRPITPSGTGRAAPQICSSGAPTDGSQMQSVRPLDLKSGRESGAPEITKDQPLGGGPSRKLNYIIGVWRQGERWSSSRWFRTRAEEVESDGFTSYVGH